ncbi:VWA domain-containing protein [Planococcus sp. ANT_H30]|nr:VWA domain-containing protein [Planococcus sp. ANT_H30]KAA0956546.1 VWA domain-containing protein [Planococcus sp. ANT_H30]
MFHVPDIDQVTDEEVYSQLLDEFQMWFKKAKEKRILR